MSRQREDDNFLSRWSRRKLNARDEPAATGEVVEEPKAENEDAHAEADAEALEEAHALSEEDVEKLTPESDYSIFMRKGVAPQVKRLALRKLWLSDPVLANLDGLNDYDGDFTAAATGMKTFSSSWLAGRGYDFGTPELTDDAAVEQVPQVAAAETAADVDASRPEDLQDEEGMPDGQDADAGNADDVLQTG